MGDDDMEQWKSKISTLATTAVLTLAPFAAFAADEPAGRYSSVDTTWVLIGAFLVFFMQPGFAMVETGLTRAKNAGNIVMKNFMDFALGSIVFWVIGFGLMFGEDVNGIIGMPDFFVQNFRSLMMRDIRLWHILFSRRYFVRPRRRLYPGRWQNGQNSQPIAFIVLPSACSFIRFPATGPGAAAGWPRWASMILPVLP
jgi:hypothetical protein